MKRWLTVASEARLQWIGPRGRRIVHTGAWSMAAKIAAAGNLFITVPFVLRALGPIEFGAWATLASLVTFAGFLDFGFGNGTMNLVAAAQGRGNATEIADIVHEGRRTLLRIAAMLGILGAACLPLVPWYRLLGLPHDSAGASRAAAAAVLGCIVLSVPLNLSNRLQLGLGRGDRAFRWQTAGQVLTAGTVIVAARLQASFVILTIATVATPLLASLGNSLSLWRSPAMHQHSAKPPSWIASSIRKEGLLFFALQLGAVLSFSSDLPLISALLGPAEAGKFAIVQRLFSIIPLGLSLVWAPLWPLYRQALAAEDHAWVSNTLRRSLFVALLCATTGALVLAVGFDRLVALWIHRPLQVSWILIAGFGVWCVVDAVGTAIATFLNAASILRFQVGVAIVLATITITGKFFALKVGALQLMPWITSAAYVVVSLIPTIALFRWLIRGMRPQIIETTIPR